MQERCPPLQDSPAVVVDEHAGHEPPRHVYTPLTGTQVGPLASDASDPEGPHPARATAALTNPTVATEKNTRSR